MFAFGQSRGFTIAEMAQAARVAPQDIVDPNKRVPDVAAQRLWRHLSEQSDDSALAIKLAAGAPMSMFGGLAEGAIYAATLKQALQHFQKNMSMIGDRIVLEIVEHPGSVAVSVSHPLDGEDDGQTSLVGILLVKRLISDVLGVPEALAHAKLRGISHSDVQEFARFMNSSVELGHDINTLFLSRQAFDSPINHANAELFAYVEMHFLRKRDVLEQSDPSAGLDRLRHAVAVNSLSSDYDLASVARRANMSLRSAQRLAAREGTTLHALVTDVRIENAKAMLGNADLSVISIAEVLGFSDDRSFRRAFKRTTGLSPSQFRALEK